MRTALPAAERDTGRGVCFRRLRSRGKMGGRRIAKEPTAQHAVLADGGAASGPGERQEAGLHAEWHLAEGFIAAVMQVRLAEYACGTLHTSPALPHSRINVCFQP